MEKGNNKAEQSIKKKSANKAGPSKQNLQKQEQRRDFKDTTDT